MSEFTTGTAAKVETPAGVDWPLRLFNKSVLKQRKLREIVDMLGPVDGQHCLDIGGDNGVISYLLRQRGGAWKSADLDAHTVNAIRELVGPQVYQINDRQVPFDDNEFDAVVIVDFLEHIERDDHFIAEMQRILKPGGRLIINVPHIKNSLLRRLRQAIGQTDEKHGHLRQGYNQQTIEILLGDRFTLEASKTYSKFFSEFIDTLIVFSVSLLKGKKQEQSKKGLVVTGKDLKAYQSMFRLYALIYPLVWLVSKLDALLFFRSGYMWIGRARVRKS
ncbi:MAG: class I SAM-dependent methyltransferase [Chloroflexi bacterium]|nr:class I SAM-dependent methyltransferase [Chloroflexota bacterium]